VAADTPGLTPLGAELVAAFGDSIDALSVAAGPEAVRRIADDLVTEHHANWRLSNVVPDERAVRAVVSVWERGDPVTTDPATYAGRASVTEPSGDNPLARLAVAWLENETEVRALSADEELFAKRFPGATPSHVTLMAGDYTATRAAALARIADGTADNRTWSMLVVAHDRACPTPGRSPLVRLPELVRAAFARLPGNGVDPLLALLSRYEAGTSMSDSMRR
jgi:hypothetical protein